MGSEAGMVLKRLIEASEEMSKLVATKVGAGELEGDAELSDVSGRLDEAIANAKAHYDHVYNAV